jgi:hypothetical protein
MSIHPDLFKERGIGICGELVAYDIPANNFSDRQLKQL